MTSSNSGSDQIKSLPTGSGSNSSMSEESPTPANNAKAAGCSQQMKIIAILSFVLVAVACGVGVPLYLKSTESSDLSSSASSSSNNQDGVNESTSSSTSTTTTQGAPAVTTSLSSTATSTGAPTASPTNLRATGAPTETTITFRPGNLIKLENDMLLSAGLSSRILAQSDNVVVYANRTFSDRVFHRMPDFGHVFMDDRPGNEGGWIYVSNSEIRHPEPKNLAGVGALTFNRDGDVIDYKMLLENSTANCAGGATAWGTWVSCEEDREGNIWQVDPTGARDPELITVGLEQGFHEAFASDLRDPDQPVFYVTEDRMRGTVRRWRPTNSSVLEWDLLHGPGITEYLMLFPDDGSNLTGSYLWSPDYSVARENAFEFYKHSEGLDVTDNVLTFCTNQGLLFELDLDGNRYTRQLQRFGLSDTGIADQFQRVLGGDNLMYFTEDGHVRAGIHARSRNGRFYTILNSVRWTGETSGLAFTPDGKRMYMAFQHDGVLLEITRQDGLGFQDPTLEPDYFEYAVRSNGPPLEEDDDEDRRRRNLYKL